MITDEIKQEFARCSNVREKMELYNTLVGELFSLSDCPFPIGRVRWVPIEDVESNDYNPNSVATVEMKLLYTSIKHDGYCVSEKTPILKADLTWAPAGHLVEGDEIIAFDEFGGTEGKKDRKMVTTKVTSNYVEVSPLVLVESEKGSLECTPDHPFLAKKCYGKGHYQAEWIEAKDLKEGDIILHLLDTWETDLSYESGWLSGFLDADGTIAVNQVNSRVASQTMRLSGYQRPSDTADRMVEAMKRVIPEAKVFIVDRTENEKWSDMVMCRVDRKFDIMRLLGSIRPKRLIEKAGRFWEGSSLTSNTQGGSDSVVKSVTQISDGKIARLGTESRTYIANGFAVHNTQPVVTIWDEEKQKYVIVDGFHRYTTMRMNKDLRDMTGGLLPIVVIRKDINDRMASTVRHNRARGKHSISGMANMVFEMLEKGWDDERVCSELGMSADELVRLKHVTGFSKLFENVEYRRSWEEKRQLEFKREYLKENPDAILKV